MSRAGCAERIYGFGLVLRVHCILNEIFPVACQANSIPGKGEPGLRYPTVARFHPGVILRQGEPGAEFGIANFPAMTEKGKKASRQLKLGAQTRQTWQYSSCEYIPACCEP